MENHISITTNFAHVINKTDNKSLARLIFFEIWTIIISMIDFANCNTK